MRKVFFNTVSLISNWRVLGFSAISIAAVLAVSSCHLFENKPITVAAHIWPGYEPMFLARSEGWLDAQQVSLLETATSTESIQALMDNKADAAALTLDETLKARAMGLPLTVVMVFNISVGADMLVADKSIKTLRDLKGKRVAYEASSLADVMLVNILQQASLNEQDVKLVKVGINKQVAAWQRKQADAFVTYEPVATQLLSSNMHKLFDSRQIPNTIVDVLVVRQDVIDAAHSKAIRHLISAHFRALSHLKHNPQDAAYRMSEHLKIDAQKVLGAYKGLLLPDADNNYLMLADENPPLLVSARKLAALMQQHKLIDHSDDLSSLIDAGYLPKDFETVND